MVVEGKEKRAGVSDYMHAKKIPVGRTCAASKNYHRFFTMTVPMDKPACKSLVLDAGPLLSLSPLRGLAEHYLTVPQVLSELKDKNAREHFEKLGLVTGVKIEVCEPDAKSLTQGMVYLDCFDFEGGV